MALHRFLEKIDRKDWRNAVIGGLLIGLLPVVGIGAGLLNHGIFDDTMAAWMFGAVLLLAGGMFGVTGAAITLLFSIWIRQSPRAMRHLIGEYEKFAREVDGELLVAYPPRLVRFLGPTLRQVSFQAQGREVHLEIISEESDDLAVVYTCLTCPLCGTNGFRCQIYPSGLLSRISESFVTHHVRLGSPEFAERFVVKATDESRAADLLSDQFQTRLLDLAEWADGVRNRSVIDSRFIELRIEPETMSIRLLAYLATAEKLVAFTRRSLQLWNLVQLQ